MIKTIAALLSKQRHTVRAEVGLDHIELGKDVLLLGLQVGWFNNTPDPVVIRGVSVYLHHEGKKETPVELTYHGRFVRIPFQKTITKIAGANTFHIKPGLYQIECLRFLTTEILDLSEGTYRAELHTAVADGTYLHNFEMKVLSSQKYRIAEQESEAGVNGTSTSSVFKRASRIAPTRSGLA